MPELIALLPAIAAITEIAGTGVSLGLDLSNQPGSPPKIPAATPQTPAANASQAAAVSSTLPTLQSLTGGSLSPEYASQYGASQAGEGNNPAAAGNVQAAINQFFGLTAPGTTGLTTSGPSSGGTSASSSITDMLSKLPTGGGSSGGGAGGSGLVDGLLNSDSFRGLAG